MFEVRKVDLATSKAAKAAIALNGRSFEEGDLFSTFKTREEALAMRDRLIEVSTTSTFFVVEA